jgi:hypothetical protein
MNFPTQGRRICTAGAILGALGALGCHTWQGVKEDTRHAVHETGRGLKKAGKKMEGTDEKKPEGTDEKKPADSPATPPRS